jgi:hypothetical protein
MWWFLSHRDWLARGDTCGVDQGDFGGQSSDRDHGDCVDSSELLPEQLVLFKKNMIYGHTVGLSKEDFIVNHPFFGCTGLIFFFV